MTTTSRTPAARIARLRGTDRSWLVDYALWKAHRLEDRFPRRTEQRLAALRRDLDDVLVAATGADAAAVGTLRSEYAELRRQQQDAAGLYGVADTNLTELQYVVTRALRPRTVVETGVWRGLSSWTLLAALDANGTGRLVSVDFPPLDPAQRVDVGHLVPDRLRARWTLEIGPSRQVLPRVLDACGPLDVFVHDSDHTYFSMMREFRTGWGALAAGGVLLSDDIEANHAFVKFARRVGQPPLIAAKRQRAGYLGLLRKP